MKRQEDDEKLYFSSSQIISIFLIDKSANASEKYDKIKSCHVCCVLSSGAITFIL